MQLQKQPTSNASVARKFLQESPDKPTSTGASKTFTMKYQRVLMATEEWSDTRILCLMNSQWPFPSTNSKTLGKIPQMGGSVEEKFAWAKICTQGWR